MSTRVTASARISAACRQLVNQRLNITLGSTVELDRASTALASGQVDLPALQGLAAGGEMAGVLATLAPVPLARARDILAGSGAVATDSSALAMSARVELASAVTMASSAIAGATRDITAEAFAGAGTELQYSVSICRGRTVTGVELRRAHEVLLLRIHDGGLVESDHAGLVDSTCGDRQRELEKAVARRGIELAGRKQLNHGTYHGGELISAAVSRGDESLARATVTDAEQPPPRTHDHRLFSGGEAETSRRSRQRRGGAA